MLTAASCKLHGASTGARPSALSAVAPSRPFPWSTMTRKGCNHTHLASQPRPMHSALLSQSQRYRNRLTVPCAAPDGTSQAAEFTVADSSHAFLDDTDALATRSQKHASGTAVKDRSSNGMQFTSSAADSRTVTAERPHTSTAQQGWGHVCTCTRTHGPTICSELYSGQRDHICNLHYAVHTTHVINLSHHGLRWHLHIAPSAHRPDVHGSVPCTTALSIHSRRACKHDLVHVYV